MRVRLDKIASSTRNANINADARLSPEIIAQEGYVVAVKVLSRKNVYNELESPQGRLVKIKDGDIIAGVLGARKALRGYAGYVPEKIAAGDRLNILNMGGVIGKCVTASGEVGDPFPVEILGSILTFPSIEERIGVPAHIRKGPVAWVDSVGGCPPVLYVSGTCMSTGKTTACAEIIRELTHRGYRVAAAKVTGVSLLRDTLAMEDCGAVKSFNFTDAGVASTTNTDEVLPIARGILKELKNWDPSVLVVELGDGIAGEYGVATILKDPELMSYGAAHVVCASDPVAAWGALRFFEDKFARQIAVMTGPVTDNEVGRDYVQRSLGLPAWNARSDHTRLVDLLETRIQAYAGGTR
ncbi:MAG: hypothetical protein V1495_10700 [Pseudomonadota bacterium]